MGCDPRDLGAQSTSFPPIIHFSDEIDKELARVDKNEQRVCQDCECQQADEIKAEHLTAVCGHESVAEDEQRYGEGIEDGLVANVLAVD